MTQLTQTHDQRGALLRHLILIATALLVLGIVSWLPALPQPAWYHDFADQRALLGIPHFHNVASNLAFLWVGLWGLWQLSGGRTMLQHPVEYSLWRGFFFSVCLIALGSSYYHLAPDNHTLIWDRLAIAIAFAYLLSIALAESIHPRLGKWASLVLLPYAILSVLYWWWSEQAGAGDLRPYLLLQGYGLLLLPLLYALYRGHYNRRGYMHITVLLYLLAMLSEWLDTQILELSGFISGHTLKHLLVALSIYSLIRMLQRRQPRTAHPRQP